MKSSNILFSFLLSTLLIQCSSSTLNQNKSLGKSTNTIPLSTEKINGVSFVSPSNEIDSKEIKTPKEVILANYLSLMPYGFIDKASTDLTFNREWQWWGEKSLGIKKMIDLAHQEGYQIMLKPHVWKRHGEFTGNHTHDNSEDWQAFEKSYENYILHFAEIAENEGVAVFCIGTEWGSFVLERPLFWNQLIQKVRKKFSGKITYAANWDEYQKVHFWEDLDFIGVDAYFPLANDETPSVSSLESALIPYKEELKALSDSLQQQLLFTEYGYRSRDSSAFKPWEAGRDGKVNLTAQSNGYQAFYNTFWNEPFVSGGFLWKWFPKNDEVGGTEDNGFTPQNKPVEKIIRNEFAN